MWWLLACSPPEAKVTPPEVHGWVEEGVLVVEGLEEVERMWNSGQKAASRVLAERVYTERWEPRLEEAARQLDGREATTLLELRFGQLLVDLEGQSRDRVTADIDALQREVRRVADAAARAFPPAGVAPPPEAPKAPEGVKPIVPDAKPNWE
jgi:predicted component of type VI protein secretion system